MSCINADKVFVCPCPEIDFLFIHFFQNLFRDKGGKKIIRIYPHFVFDSMPSFSFKSLLKMFTIFALFNVRKVVTLTGIKNVLKN